MHVAAASRDVWSDNLLKEELKSAAATLRRLPSGRARAQLTSWPDVVQDTAHALYSDGARPRLGPARPVEIDRMERTLVWLLACSSEQRRIVWARAYGVSWRKLEDIDGRSHVTLRKIEEEGLHCIRRLLYEQQDLAPVFGFDRSDDCDEATFGRVARRAG